MPYFALLCSTVHLQFFRIEFGFISCHSELAAFVCISVLFCCFYTFACAGVVQLLQCWVSGASLGFLGCFILFSTASVNPNWIQGKHFHSTSLCSASLLVQASFVDFAVGLQNPCFSLNLFRPGHHGGDASHGLLQPRRFAVFVWWQEGPSDFFESVESRCLEAVAWSISLCFVSVRTWWTRHWSLGEQQVTHHRHHSQCHPANRSARFILTDLLSKLIHRGFEFKCCRSSRRAKDCSAETLSWWSHERPRVPVLRSQTQISSSSCACVQHSQSQQ